MTLLAKTLEEMVESTKGLKIFVRSWMPTLPPRAVLVICHGVNSHSGQYLWAGEQFAAAGYATFALDLRGRGRSEGQRFYVDDVADYVSDVANTIALARGRHQGLPVLLLGHSAGGVTAASFVLDHQVELAGFICESFAFQVPAPGFALAAIKGLSHIAPNLPVLKLKNEDFSGSEFFYDTAGSTDKSLKLYEGHYHDLLNDLGKEQVMGDILSWIGARLPTA